MRHRSLIVEGSGLCKEVIQARIDGKIKEEAAVVLVEVGLSVSDAFRLMMLRIAAEKRRAFGPLIPRGTDRALSSSPPMWG